MTLCIDAILEAPDSQELLDMLSRNDHRVMKNEGESEVELNLLQGVTERIDAAVNEFDKNDVPDFGSCGADSTINTQALSRSKSARLTLPTTRTFIALASKYGLHFTEAKVTTKHIDRAMGPCLGVSAVSVVRRPNPRV